MSKTSTCWGEEQSLRSKKRKVKKAKTAATEYWAAELEQALLQDVFLWRLF
jgi:hypothetical protein